MQLTKTQVAEEPSRPGQAEDALVHGLGGGSKMVSLKVRYLFISFYNPLSLGFSMWLVAGMLVVFTSTQHQTDPKGKRSSKEWWSLGWPVGSLSEKTSLPSSLLCQGLKRFLLFSASSQSRIFHVVGCWDACCLYIHPSVHFEPLGCLLLLLLAKETRCLPESCIQKVHEFVGAKLEKSSNQ